LVRIRKPIAASSKPRFFSLETPFHLKREEMASECVGSSRLFELEDAKAGLFSFPFHNLLRVLLGASLSLTQATQSLV
jgi:hypothetical protein